MRRFAIVVTTLLMVTTFSRGQTIPSVPAGQSDFEKLWNVLADPDAAKAYRAICMLTSAPKETISLFADKLQKPTAAPDPKIVAGLVKDLSHDTFAVREQATQELIKLGEWAEPALREFLAGNPALEAGRRTQIILRRLAGPTSPETLRVIRAVEALEYIPLAESKALLAKCVAGAPGTRLALEAKQALERLAGGESQPQASLKMTRTDLFGDPLPDGAIGRLGTIRFRRENWTSVQEGVAFQADGRTVVTYPVGAGFLFGDFVTQLWDVDTGRLLRTLNTEPLYISACAISSDAKQIAVAGALGPRTKSKGKCEIRIFDLPSGDLVKTITQNNELVQHLALDSHGTLFTWSLAFSDKGNVDRLNGVLRIHEIASGKELEKKELPPETGARMALSDDGKYLAFFSGAKEGKLLLWDWRAKKQRIVEPGFAGNRLEEITFSKSGKYLAGVQKGSKAQPGTLYVWEIPQGRLAFKKELESVAPEMCLFIPNEKSLLVSGENGTKNNNLLILEPSTGRQMGVLQNIGPGQVHFAVSRDARTLAVTSSLARSQVVRLWDLPSQKEITPAGHPARPTYFRVVSQGTLASSDKQEVRFWNTFTGKTTAQFGLPDSATHGVVSSKGSLLAYSNGFSEMHVWNSATSKEIHRLNEIKKSKNENPREDVLGFTADESGLYSFRHDLTLRLWDMKTGKLKAERFLKPKGVENLPDGKRPGRVVTRGFVMSPDAKTVIIHLGIPNPPIPNGKANSESTYYVFDTASGKETIRIALGNDTTARLAISPNGRWLLSREDEKFDVALTDLASGKTWQRIPVPGTAYPVAFSTDGRMFALAVDGAGEEAGLAAKSVRGPAVAARSREIQIYEIASGKLRGKFNAVPSGVGPLAFFPDGRRLASGMNDSTILIWDLMELK